MTDSGKELENYIEHIFGDEKGDLTWENEIQSVGAGFLAGYNTLRKKILIKIAELKSAQKEIKSKTTQEQIFSKRELNKLEIEINLLESLL